MNSPLLEGIGLSGLDPAYLFLFFLIAVIALLIALILQSRKIRKLERSLKKFTRGKDGASLEKEINQLFTDNRYLMKHSEEQQAQLQEIRKQVKQDFCKVGVVKYDAFHQMGGKLSYVLCMLDDYNNGFVMNSVHSVDGCYSYIKEIRRGESDVELGSEEQEAMEQAMQAG